MAKRKPNWGVGIALGMGTGIALGSALGNVAIGVALGAGMAVVWAIALGQEAVSHDGDGANSDDDPISDVDADDGAAD
ncbi:MAG: hypothetical protein QUV02_11200 [Maricaulis sp.]|jgi:hypothetical protein|uniref:hypothetical protein n=1 Tax=Maricaulis sp. TaxID=1486257 RepID=UPI001B078943|nr:hypothetical protein [Maricaulis sp.]MBO6728628.1 hypothetical protein [Maricaulis sp.]MBO6846147.1 hypothetical protein [Maricaulis sp.]MBO6875976.1 hypothetical protein [Maricaulis sp.]MDM7985011.1 hypothetical protein [Maricaulis sp.]